MPKEPIWCITVECDGKEILRISHNHVSGVEQFTERQEDIIRNAGEQLLSFIGEKK